MSKSNFDYIRNLLLIFIFVLFVHIIYFIVFSHEVFAMEPNEILRSFNPDTYIRHELDGTPIHVSGRVKNYSHSRDYYHLSDRYVPKSLPVDSHAYYHLDPTQDRYELNGNPIDKDSLEGKLRSDLQTAQHLSDLAKQKLFVTAKNKQRRCGEGLPVYHKKVIDLYSKSDSDYSSSTRYTIKECFGKRILRCIDNKPTGILDYRHVEARAERERRAYLYKQSQYKE